MTIESDNLYAFAQLHSALVDLTMYVIDVLEPAMYLQTLVHLFHLASSLFIICLHIKAENHLLENGYFIAQCFSLALHVISLISEIAIYDSATIEVLSN